MDSRSSRRVIVAAVTSLALVLAFPGAADARRHRPAAKPFAASGLIVRHTGSTVTVLTTALRQGHRTTARHTITVGLPARRTAAGRALAQRLARTRPGDRIAVTGTSAGARFTARNLATSPAPYHVYLGRVTAVNGALVTLAKGTDPSDDTRERDSGAFTVDLSAATVSVDGAPGSLAVGDTAAVLGSSVADVVVATAAFGFTTAPDRIRGSVSAVNGAVATVGDGEYAGGDRATSDGVRPADDNQGDGSAPAGTAVDLSAATLIVDGTSGADPATLPVGARLLALGTDHGDGTFTATIAFAFTRSCSSRSHGDGGQDSGD